MLSPREQRILDAVPESEWTKVKPVSTGSRVCMRKASATLKGLVLMGLLEHEFTPELGDRYRRKALA